MGTSVTVRLATPADASALARLRHEFRVALEPATEPADVFLVRLTAWMTDRLSAGGEWRCWVAEDAAELIGSVCIHRMEKMPNPSGESEAQGYLTNFYVRPQHRGRGVGSRLLAEAMADCDRRGLSSVVLWSTVEGRPVYLRHGFSVPSRMLERVNSGALGDSTNSP